MERAEFHRHLARDRELVRLAAERFEVLAAGREHPRIDSARMRLADAGTSITHAAGGLSPWARTAVGVPPLAIVFAAVAGLGRAAGLPAGVAGTAGVAAAMTMSVVVLRLMNALAGRLDRWRTRAPRVEMPAGVLPALREVRWSLRALMRHRADSFGTLAAGPGGFDRLRRADRRLWALSLTDRCVCQAVDAIELWLDVREEAG